MIEYGHSVNDASNTFSCNSHYCVKRLIGKPMANHWMVYLLSRATVVQCHNEDIAGINWVVYTKKCDHYFIITQRYK